jgi:hypothetical protein
MFGIDVRTVNEHIQHFMADGELDASTFRDFRIVRMEGTRKVERSIEHYGLDVAFYVGYRVNSVEGKLFRRWATAMLVQLATKGFVVNQRMLKGGENAERIRELRRIIQKKLLPTAYCLLPFALLPSTYSRSGITAVTSISTTHSGRARAVTTKPVDTGYTPFRNAPISR